MIGAMLRVLVIGLVLLVGIMLALSGLRRPLPAPEHGTFFETPLELTAFSLEDTEGGSFARDDLRGRYSMMFFGFTSCPDICPITLAKLAEAYREIERTGIDLPGLVFVSVDPDRDSPEAIAAYLQNFDAGFAGVTGDRRQLDPLLRTLGVTVMIHEAADGSTYTVTHTGTVFVLGPDADVIATIDGSISAAEIATDFRRVRALDLQRRANSSAS